LEVPTKPALTKKSGPTHYQNGDLSVKRISWSIAAALIVGLFMPVSAVQALSDGQLTCVKNQVILEGGIAVATDSQGNIYETDGNLVRKVNGTTGDATIVAGTGDPGFSGDGGLAINAKLWSPSGIAVSGTTLYIADSRNERIRKVNLLNGNISTFASNVGGLSSIAVFNGVVDATINGQVFKFDSSGVKTRVVDQFDGFITIAFDSNGNLFAAQNTKKVFKITPAEVITTFAGTGDSGNTGDDGLATAATFDSLDAVAIDSSNNVYISSTSAQIIRKVNASDGKISTFVTGVNAFSLAMVNSETMIFGENVDPNEMPKTGKIKSINLQTKVFSDLTGGSPFLFGPYTPSSGNGGLAKNANLGGSIAGFYIDPISKDMYLSSNSDSTIRKIDGTTGIISMFAGSYDQSLGRDVNVIATQTRLIDPDQVVKSPDGNFYFSDYELVKKIDKTTKIISVVAGGGEENTEGGLAINAKIGRPRGVAFDSLGNLYFAEMGTDQLRVARIRKINPNGQIFTIAGTSEPGNDGMGYSGDGGPASAAKLQAPNAMVIDGQNNLYFAESDGNVIRKINLSATTPTITKVAGQGSNAGLAFTGLATSAVLDRPAYDGNLVLGPDGNLYWGEGFFGWGVGGAIRSVDLSSGPNAAKISTVLLNAWQSINFDANGNLLAIVKGSIFKLDKTNNTISLIAGSPGTSNIGGSLVTNLKVGCNLVPQVAISVGSTPNSQVATIPDGQTRAAIPATATLPAITLNFGGTSPTAITVAPVASNPVAASITPFKIVSGTTKIVDITPTGTFTGSATVCLDGASTDSIFHFVGGKWEELASRSYVNGQVCGVTTSFSPFAAAEKQLIVAPVAVPVPVPDPVQQSKITALSVATAIAGTPTPVEITGSFVEKIRAIQINGVALAAGSWTQTVSSVAFTMPGKSAGTYQIQLFNGSAPVLKVQNFTFTSPIVVVAPTPTPTAKPKVTYIRCAKPGHGTRVAYGVNPTCPSGYVKK
jgi:sugar lactone lactonase YvrE